MAPSEGVQTLEPDRPPTLGGRSSKPTNLCAPPKRPTKTSGFQGPQGCKCGAEGHNLSDLFGSWRGTRQGV